MSDYVARWRDENAMADPASLLIRRWAAWIVWLVVVPLTMVVLIQLFG